jgi:Uncharacterized conserved protein
MEEVLQRLRSGIVYVATVNGDKPACRPFGAAIKHEEEIYLFTSREKDVFKQMLVNPNIEVVAMGDDMGWMRLSAKVAPADDDLIVEMFLEDDPELKRDYAVGDGHAMPLKLTEVVAKFYSDSGLVREIKL